MTVLICNQPPVGIVGRTITDGRCDRDCEEMQYEGSESILRRDPAGGKLRFTFGPFPPAFRVVLDGLGIQPNTPGAGRVGREDLPFSHWGIARGAVVNDF
jgi:hypothetical protein